jgi:RNA polymerase sigma-70 factor (ECF subfamily)
MASQEELRLVADVVEGRGGALEAFIAEYRAFVYAILTRHLNLYPADADEVFQRFLIHVWEGDYRRLRRWSGRGTLAAYLGTMVRNLTHDYRRQAARQAAPEDLECLSESRSPEKDERAMLLETALDRLPPRDRDLIRRRYDGDQSYREIAEELGITVGNVGVSLHRAEKRLKKLLPGRV